MRLLKLKRMWCLSFKKKKSKTKVVLSRRSIPEFPSAGGGGNLAQNKPFKCYSIFIIN